MTSNKTWIVMCPKWQSKSHVNNPHAWSLPQKDLKAIGKDYFEPLIECIVCNFKFSLHEGLKEAFRSDHPFISNILRFNSREHGSVDITVGQLKRINFSMPFDTPPEVYLTPYKKFVCAIPGYITNSGFSIFSCGYSDQDLGETRTVTWSAYGFRMYSAIPLWRKLLSSSIGHRLRRDFRSELVDLESAFEVFIGEFLGNRLKNKFREETVNWILKKSIEEQVKIGFTELEGKPLHEIEPEAYSKWQKNVKELRDFVVHRGQDVSEEQAKEARSAVFDLITKIDPSTIDHFQIQIEKLRREHPNMTFGTAVIKGRKNI